MGCDGGRMSSCRLPLLRSKWRRATITTAFIVVYWVLGRHLHGYSVLKPTFPLSPGLTQEFVPQNKKAISEPHDLGRTEHGFHHLWWPKFPVGQTPSPRLCRYYRIYTQNALRLRQMSGAPRPNSAFRMRVFFLACAALLCCGETAFAIDPSLDLSQYAHSAWFFRNGFLNGAVYAITQTPDGYLWLGTQSGVVRFDGARAVPLALPPGQQLPSTAVGALLSARDGTLWIGTLDG